MTPRELAEDRGLTPSASPGPEAAATMATRLMTKQQPLTGNVHELSVNFYWSSKHSNTQTLFKLKAGVLCDVRERLRILLGANPHPKYTSFTTVTSLLASLVLTFCDWRRHGNGHSSDHWSTYWLIINDRSADFHDTNEANKIESITYYSFRCWLSQ